MPADFTVQKVENDKVNQKFKKTVSIFQINKANDKKMTRKEIQDYYKDFIKAMDKKYPKKDYAVMLTAYSGKDARRFGNLQDKRGDALYMGEAEDYNTGEAVDNKFINNFEGFQIVLRKL